MGNHSADKDNQRPTQITVSNDLTGKINREKNVDDNRVWTSSHHDRNDNDNDKNKANHNKKDDDDKDNDDNNDGGNYTILALYKFFVWSEPIDDMKARLEEFLRPRHVRGLLLLAAQEGINGTISYPTQYHMDIQTFFSMKILCWEEKLVQMKEQGGIDIHSSSMSTEPRHKKKMQNVPHLQAQPDYQRLRVRASHNNPSHVFHRLKIKVKKEIVSMTGGIPLCQVIPNFLSHKDVIDNDIDDDDHEKDDGKSGSPTTQSSTATIGEPSPAIAVEQEKEEESTAPTPTSPTSMTTTTRPPPAPSASCVVGTYVPPGSEWHALLNDPRCWVIDMRNSYEVALGTFPTATDPGLGNFTEFPLWFQRQLESRRLHLDTKNDDDDENNNNDIPRFPFDKVAMFCTGGIRCEKASAYCLNQMQKYTTANDKDRAAGGSTTNTIPVYHLEGGILAYLDQVPIEQSQWHGECFVFDQRTAVTYGLRPSLRYIELCHACRHALSADDVASTHYKRGIACPYCSSNPDREQRRQRYQERQVQMQLSQHRRTKHIHDPKEEHDDKKQCGGRQGCDTSCVTERSNPKQCAAFVVDEPILGT